MTDETPQSNLRNIPAVDDVLNAPPVAELRNRHPRVPWTILVRRVLEGYRGGRFGRLPAEKGAARDAIVARVNAQVTELQAGGQRPVLNATGVILHTNLGRAVLGASVRSAVGDAMSGYVNLEVDLETGQRSHRADTLNELIALAAHAEAAMVVNNNAAAVYLVVNSLSPPGRVIVSRGELVEIGGSFRLPDILHRAAAEVIEVGTTNRTYASDYAKVAKPGDVFLRAHRSNYELKGFTHEATLAELVDVGRSQGCYVVYDLGSGSFFDFAGVGLGGEERVQEVMAAGVDCVTMSGDKLLGGVQAGLVVGKRDFLDRLKGNPLRRAVRVDKITIAALQALMRGYLFGPDPVEDTPVLRQATRAMVTLRHRADKIASSLRDSVSAFEVSVTEDAATVGGGSFAGVEVPSVAVQIRLGTDEEARGLAHRLRQEEMPVFCRIRGQEIRFNLRTIPDERDEDLIAAIRHALEAG